MENIGHIVAENLKRLREERKLSLDAVAKCSGVSKSMLGQIERGVTNPTISTLWKPNRTPRGRRSSSLFFPAR